MRGWKTSCGTRREPVTDGRGSGRAAGLGGVDESEVREAVAEVVERHEDQVAEEGMGAFSALMGEAWARSAARPTAGRSATCSARRFKSGPDRRGLGPHRRRSMTARYRSPTGRVLSSTRVAERGLARSARCRPCLPIGCTGRQSGRELTRPRRCRSVVGRLSLGSVLFGCRSGRCSIRARANTSRRLSGVSFARKG